MNQFLIYREDVLWAVWDDWRNKRWQWSPSFFCIFFVIGNSLNVFIGAAAGFVAAVALINSGLATSFYSTPVRAVPQVIVPSSLAASSQLPVVPKETNIQVNSAQILYPGWRTSAKLIILFFWPSDSTVKGQERTITILGVCSFLSASLFYIWKQFGMKVQFLLLSLFRNCYVSGQDNKACRSSGSFRWKNLVTGFNNWK